MINIYCVLGCKSRVLKGVQDFTGRYLSYFQLETVIVELARHPISKTRLFYYVYDIITIYGLCV